MWVTHEDGGKKSGIYGLVYYCHVNQNANQQKLFARTKNNRLLGINLFHGTESSLRLAVFTEPSIQIVILLWP